MKKKNNDCFWMENIFCLESHIHLCSRHTSANPAYVIKTCVTWHAIFWARCWGFVSPKLHVSTYRNQQHCWWFQYSGNAFYIPTVTAGNGLMIMQQFLLYFVSELDIHIVLMMKWLHIWKLYDFLSLHILIKAIYTTFNRVVDGMFSLLTTSGPIH